MRHAMKQIWLLYGPDAFISDVQDFMLSRPVGLQIKDSWGASSTDRIIDFALNSNEDKGILLCHCASALLLNPSLTLMRLASHKQFAEAVENARRAQSSDSSLLQHFDAVLEHAKHKQQKNFTASPAILSNQTPKVCLFGRHSNRTPLSYEPIQRIIGSRLKFVENPSHADVIVSGFNIDFRDGIDELIPLLKGAHKPKLAVISEEPLWDVTWSGPFRGKDGKITAKEMEIEYTFLGHETSDIFDFEKIPYFLLTSNSYLVRYANMLSRFVKISAKEMCERWSKSSISAAFFMEKRKGDAYSKSFNDRGIKALSAYRTSVAEHMQPAKGVVCVGRGWSSDVRRQTLPDWHLDKLAYLDGRTRILSAFENVHQRNYITEKIFDAFAVGSVPVYWADPQHRIFDMILGESFINTYKLDPADAALKLGSFITDMNFADQWRESALKLGSLFSCVDAIHAERERVANSSIREIIKII